jgi:hypothetical protein
MELKYWGMLKFHKKKLNGKWKTEARRFSFIRSPSAHRANGSLSFVHLFAKKQTEVVH